METPKADPVAQLPYADIIEVRGDIVIIQPRENEVIRFEETRQMISFVENLVSQDFVLVSQRSRQFTVGPGAYLALNLCARMKGLAIVVYPGVDVEVMRAELAQFRRYYSVHAEMEYALDWAKAVVNIPDDV